MSFFWMFWNQIKLDSHSLENWWAQGTEEQYNSVDHSQTTWWLLSWLSQIEEQETDRARRIEQDINRIQREREISQQRIMERQNQQWETAWYTYINNGQGTVTSPWSMQYTLDDWEPAPVQVEVEDEQVALNDIDVDFTDENWNRVGKLYMMDWVVYFDWKLDKSARELLKIIKSKLENEYYGQNIEIPNWEPHFMI